MPLKAGSYAKIILLEIAWLLGSWAISFGLLGWFIGFKLLGLKQLEIQLHNTYFVMPPWAAALPFLVPVATAVTLVRGAIARFKPASSKIVLGLLSAGWVCLVLLLVMLLKGVH